MLPLRLEGGEYYDAKSNGHDRTNPFVAIYSYVDESGELLFQVCRKPDKTFPQRKPDGNGGWTWKTGDVRKVLYRLPDLMEAIANEHTILIVEGEKDVENLRKLGLPATCNPGGAASPGQRPKWRPEYSEMLRGADVVIVPDHDEAGYAHADAIASMSIGIAKRIHILKLAERWAECPKGGDLSDWLAAGHTREELDVLIAEAAKPWSPSERSSPKDSGSQLPPLNMETLSTMTFPPIKYVVPGVIVEGLTLLAGKPKIGKSWLVLHAALAVARGGFTLGDIHCPEGDVLYCALEDNPRRLQARLTKLCGLPPWNVSRLDFYCELKRLAEGGLATLEDWIKSKPHQRLIVVDVLAMVRPTKTREQTAYEADYAAVLQLRELASRYGVAIVAVCHLRKADSDDAFDTVSGTLGLTGAPDSILVLKRDASSGAIILHGRGRDLPELEKAMQFDADTCIWRIAGEASTVRRTGERANVLQAVEESREPVTPSDVAAATKMRVMNVKFLLRKLLEEGAIERVGYGKYQARQGGVRVSARVSARVSGAISSAHSAHSALGKRMAKPGAINSKGSGKSER